MSDIADQVAAVLAQTQSNGGGISQLSAKLDTVLSAVQALATPQPATVDLSPVLTAIADVRTQLDVTKPSTSEAPAAQAG